MVSKSKKVVEAPGRPKLSLKQIACMVGGQVQGDEACEITGVAPLATAKPGQLSFFADSRYSAQLVKTEASAVILNEKYASTCPTYALIVARPELAFATVVQSFVTSSQQPVGIHPTAVVDPSSEIDPRASIGARCYIGANVVIEKNARIAPACIIGDNCRIGSDSTLWSSVVLYHGTVIGKRVIVHSGAVLGADGFRYTLDKGSWVKIPQIGNVIIGDEVEIGANTTIDRGALDNTVIERGVKLDNLIQVGHNVIIGAHTAIASATTIAGSARIGKHCMIAGCVAINGHITITDNVIITGHSSVSNSIHEPGIYSSGINIKPNKLWRKNVVRFHQLNDLALRLKTLESDFAIYLEEKVNHDE